VELVGTLAEYRRRGLTLAQLVDRLDDRFRLLTGGSRTALRRQQTLRATVDWSYDLLGEAERALLRRLSVFAGGWTLEAAEAVCADVPDVLGVLLQLVDKSLVLVDPAADGASAGAAGAEGRYRLLETIRQYAGERLLAAGEAAAARDRHRGYFLAWAERAAPHVAARDQLVWMARLEAEHENLRAALAWSQDDGSDRELRLAAALAHFWPLRGCGAEGRTRLQGALERGDPRPSRPRGVALDWLGVLETLHADFPRAVSLYQQAAEVARAVGDNRVLASALRHRGMARSLVGRPASDVRVVYEQALAAARDAGAHREVGYVLGLLGWQTFMQGDAPQGTRLLAEARRYLRAVGDRDALCSCLRLSGEVAQAQGDHAAAHTLFAEALAAAREMGHGIAVQNALTSLGDLALAQGDPVAARGRYAEALLVARDRGDRGPMLWELRALGSCCVLTGQMARATRLYGAEAAARAGAPLQGPLSPRAEQYAEGMAAARAALGDAAFAAAWAAGEAMTLEAAVAEALEAPTLLG
jgi:non-specific serine/threonine protein kinase